MAAASQTKPVEDTVPKVDNDIAVGSDLEFQRKWWRFSNMIWVVFSLIIVADLLGCFGRGPLANAQIKSTDGTIDVKYERIERFSTPSIMRVQFSPAAVHNGKVELWTSDTLVKPLGNQRVIPQPSVSALEPGGIRYTFPATQAPVIVEFALEPATPGIFDLNLRIPGQGEVDPRIYVMP